MEELIVKLEVFEGPLELLEHLIKKNKLDICAVSLIEITDQYIEYLNSMESMDLEVSTEFLIVAANLLYIKSKALLPRHEEDEDAEQAAADLTEALKERARMKLISERFRIMQFDGTFRYFKTEEKIEKSTVKKQFVNLSADKLYAAFMTVLEKTKRREPPPKSEFGAIVSREPISVKEKAFSLIKRLGKAKKLRFESIFKGVARKNEVVAIFLAVLELMKLNRVRASGEGDDIVLTVCADNGQSTEELLSNIDGD